MSSTFLFILTSKAEYSVWFSCRCLCSSQISICGYFCVTTRLCCSLEVPSFFGITLVIFLELCRWDSACISISSIAFSVAQFGGSLMSSFRSLVTLLVQFMSFKMDFNAVSRLDYESQGLITKTPYRGEYNHCNHSHSCQEEDKEETHHHPPSSPCVIAACGWWLMGRSMVIHMVSQSNKLWEWVGRSIQQDLTSMTLTTIQGIFSAWVRINWDANSTASSVGYARSSMKGYKWLKW